MIRHIFIVTYGRTGSTLLMNVLNAIDGVAIVGENFNHLYDLWTALDHLDEWQQHSGETSSAQPFYGAGTFPFSERRGVILGLIKSFFNVCPTTASAEIRGLKEVRYVLPDFHAYIDFLDQTFERSLFVCLTRDVKQCARSGFYRDYREDDVVAALRNADDAFAALARRKPTSVVRLTYDELTAGKLDELFTRIGRAPSPDELARRLGEPASYDLRSWRALGEGFSIRVDQVTLDREGLVFMVDPHKNRPGALPIAAIAGVALSVVGAPVEAVSICVGSDRVEAVTHLLSPRLKKQRPDVVGSGSGRFQVLLPASLPTGTFPILVRRAGVDTEVGQISVTRPGRLGLVLHEAAPNAEMPGWPRP